MTTNRATSLDGIILIQMPRVFMGLSDEISAFQAYAEAVRIDPDDEHLQEDLKKARKAMEVAWLNHIGTTEGDV